MNHFISILFFYLGGSVEIRAHFTAANADIGKFAFHAMCSVVSIYGKKEVRVAFYQ